MHIVIAALIGSTVGGVPMSNAALCERKGDEIVVCADPDPPLSRYRLPIHLPPSVGSAGAISVSRERNALFDYDGGGSGLCSATGAGGASGCLHKQHKARAEQRANARDKRGRIYDAANPEPR